MITKRKAAIFRVALETAALLRPDPPRSFAVRRDGMTSILSEEDHVRLMGVSAEASAAFDILADDGYPAEEAWKLILTAERSGKDPEVFARHFLKLRKALREHRL